MITLNVSSATSTQAGTGQACGGGFLSTEQERGFGVGSAWGEEWDGGWDGEPPGVHAESDHTGIVCWWSDALPLEISNLDVVP